MTVRITFWFQGARHRKPFKKNTVDAFIYIDEDELDDELRVKNAADDALSDMINKGLVDFYCDAGVSDFGVEKVSFKYKGEATFKF